MKQFALMSVLLFFGPPIVRAQEADLNKAFQSEYVYLVSQKEALTRQKQQMDKNLADRLAQAKGRVGKLQKDLVELTASNDERHEELAQLERQKKDLQKRGTSLESTYKKASKLLAETEKGLRFDTAKDKTEIVAPDDMKFGDLAPLFAKADTLLKSSAQTETFKGTYLNSEDKLSEGEVTRIGRVAAFVNSQDGRMVLGPNGAGTLKTLEKDNGKSFYLFENLNEAAHVEKAATWLEKLADLGPLAFLAMMMALVGSLFIVLVKV